MLRSTNRLVASTLCLALGSTLPMQNAGATVGVAAAVNQAAEGVRPGGAPRIISLGENVIANERIDTSDAGLVQVLLRDGTTFTVGPGTSLVIDRFVYDPDRGTAQVAATVTKGAFRMIGGLASKTRGGAKVTTPTGTIGIRGAMLEGLVDTAQGSLFSLIFGDEARFTGNDGRTTRLYEPGYTLVVKGGRRTVRRRTAGDAQAFNTALGGKPGRRGGARRAPTDPDVAQSPLPRVNSGAPLRVTIPNFRPVAVQSSEIDTIAEQTEQLVIDRAVEPRSVTFVEADDDALVSPVTPAPVPTFRPLRVRTAADATTGSRGIVGSTPGSDLTLEAEVQDGRLIGTLNGRSIDLPDFTGTQGDTALQRIVITDAVVDGAPATGVVYAGTGTFAAYTLFANGNMDEPIYAITGTPTPTTILAGNDAINRNVRTYSLTPDPIRPSPIAFFATDLYGALNNVNATPYRVIEANADAFDETLGYYTGLDISGTRGDQRSAVIAHTSRIASLGPQGQVIIEGVRRGTMRTSATLSSFNLRGPIGSITGPEDFGIYGPNGENFVIGNPTYTGRVERYTDNPIVTGEQGITFDPTGDDTTNPQFGTFHVADLTADTPQGTLSRTSRFHAGFATGLVESRRRGGIANPYFATGQIGLDPDEFNFVPNMSMTLTAESDQVNGRIFVGDRFNINPFVAALDIGFGSLNGPGGRAFIDDDNFVGLFPRDPAQTAVITDEGIRVNQRDDINAGTYLVSGRASPVPGYQHCTTCAFMDWGWWGTRVTALDQGTAGPSYGSGFDEQVHMGTWVAGDLTTDAQLPTTGVATYSGTAIGNVLDTSDSTAPATYIATGNIEMGVDFGTRSGNFAITNFDGDMSATGALGIRNDENDFAQFDAQLSNVGVDGQVSGAFANDGADIAKGVLGEFGIQDANRAAVGTFMGARN